MAMEEKKSPYLQKKTSRKYLWDNLNSNRVILKKHYERHFLIWMKKLERKIMEQILDVRHA
jgi:hypothetical protein